LRNAFHHARARRIEAEVHYGSRQLRLRIRDDGIGLKPDVFSQKWCSGNSGIKAMYHSAKLLGARIEIWTAPGAGVEVELTVPVSVAYASRGVEIPNTVNDQLNEPPS